MRKKPGIPSLARIVITLTAVLASTVASAVTVTISAYTANVTVIDSSNIPVDGMLNNAQTGSFPNLVAQVDGVMVNLYYQQSHWDPTIRPRTKLFQLDRQRGTVAGNEDVNWPYSGGVLANSPGDVPRVPFGVTFLHVDAMKNQAVVAYGEKNVDLQARAVAPPQQGAPPQQ